MTPFIGSPHSRHMLKSQLALKQSPSKPPPKRSEELALDEIQHEFPKKRKHWAPIVVGRNSIEKGSSLFYVELGDRI